MSVYKKIAACTVALGALCAAQLAVAQDAHSVVTVVKVTGENWFTRMEEGVVAYGKDNPAVSTSQIGPAKADAAHSFASSKTSSRRTLTQSPSCRWTLPLSKASSSGR